MILNGNEVFYNPEKQAFGGKQMRGMGYRAFPDVVLTLPMTLFTEVMLWLAGRRLQSAQGKESVQCECSDCSGLQMALLKKRI